MSRRIEIMRRATEIFAKKGFADTALQDIADAAGVKREALYYHFRDKAELLFNILKPANITLLEGLKRIARSDAPAKEKLRAGIAHHLAQFHPSYLEMVVAYRTMMLRQAQFAELRKAWKEYERLWIELLSKAQKDGEVDAALDAKVVAFSILGMCNSLSSWYDPSGALPLEAIVEIHFRMIWSGVASRPAAVPDSRRRAPKRPAK
jgi:TetR/AcrR family transcriptional regulator, cholesterol catabolism regulator